MTYEESESLVYKAMSVILSCRTMTQLNNAVTYSSLAYNKISLAMPAINRSRFIARIERSIGFAHCKIKANNQEV